MIHPKIGAKIINAKYCEELKIAEARPRSLVGNQEATMRPFPGKTGACANPEINLKRKIAEKAALAARYPANPVSRAQIDHNRMLIP
jgi:hypothetical protein